MQTYDNVYATTMDNVTGYANASTALSYHESLTSIGSAPTFQPDSIVRLRDAVSSDSVIQANTITNGDEINITSGNGNPPATSEPRSLLDLSEDDLFAEFSALCFDDPVATFVDGVATTNDFVEIEIMNRDNPDYCLFNDSPVDTVPVEWNFGIFPGTGVEEYGQELHWIGDAFQESPMPHTCNGIEIDPTFEFKDIQVIYAVDEHGISMPMSTAYCFVKSINGVRCDKLLKCLFDTGGSVSMAHSSVVPRDAKLFDTDRVNICNTIAGNYKPTGKITATALQFPEFDANLAVTSHDFLVFEPPCTYDLILGNDFLNKIGPKVDYENQALEWQGNRIPMNSKFSKDRLSAVVDCLAVVREEEELNDYIESFATAIADAKYDKMDVKRAIKENCDHLSASQQDDLEALLFKHYKLFNGELHVYQGEKMDIEVDESARPVHRRSYPTPRIHLQTFKTEIDRLVAIGVLKRVDGPSSWALPSFLIPKQNGSVRFICDLRELNKVIKPRDYTLPIIQQLLRDRTSFKYMTKLDLSMMFYSFELTDRAKELCTINTPFGLYSWNRAPMGLRISPAFAQAAIERVLRDIPNVVAYIDDIAVFSDSYEEHLATLDTVFAKLNEAGFSINPMKCAFGISEGDFLGHWVTQSGIKPWRKKVQAVIDLQKPTNASEVRTLIGMINWYRDHWPRRSHLLSPFTQLLRGLKDKKAPIQWTAELNTCFEEVKKVISADALNAYPDHNKGFDIYCDSSDYQCGAAILQEGRPVAYFSKRLTGPQTRYTTGEKELLAIVYTLSEYKTMLFGAKINIYTDHRNLTFSGLTSQRVLRWRCFLEQFNAKWYYFPGKLNVLADAFSRLPKFDFSGAEERQEELSKTPPILFDPDTNDGVSLFEEQLCDLAADDEFPVLAYQQLMNLPQTVQNPLRYQWLAEQQQNCPALQQRLLQSPTLYHRHTFGRHDTELICYSATPDNEDSLKIVLTDEAVDAAVEYFHLLLNHPGSKALSHALSRFYHPQLNARITAYACDVCQRTKKGQRGYGHLPPRSVEGLYPWKQCAWHYVKLT